MEGTQTTYCLQDDKTKQLVRWFTPGSYGDDSTVELTVGPLSEDWPIWELPTAQEVLTALNAARLKLPYELQASNYRRPSFRGLDLLGLKLVKRVVEERLELVPFELAPQVRQRFYSKKPHGVLTRYAGLDSIPEDVEYLFLGELPAGETLESFRRFAGTVLRCETSLCSEDVPVHAIFEVPEEYVLDLHGQQGFAAIAAKPVPAY